MCKKTRPGPTQTRKKVLPPAREPSFSKITKPENQQTCIQNGPKGEAWMRAKRTLRVPWLTGFITLWPCAPPAGEKCAKLCEKCPGKVPRAPKNEKQATESAQTLTKITPKSPKCWQMSWRVGISAKHKQKLKKTPSKKNGHFL